MGLHVFLFESLRVYFFSAKVVFLLTRYDANYNKRSGVGVEASEPTPTPTPDSWLVATTPATPTPTPTPKP